MTCARILPMKTVFMGSPEFAVPVLTHLAEHYQVIGVVTQPDRPAGRGQVLTPPPVKFAAQALGIEVIQPVKLREVEAMDKLLSWAPELIVVAAFGQILRQVVLDLPRWGCINVHASLLPRWRGAAPVQAAILNGDVHSGATIMKMDAGIDTGAILSQRQVSIEPEDTTGTLLPRLAEAGAQLLIETLPGYLNGSIVPITQDESLATYARMIQKEEALLDLTKPSETLARQVRAFQPWPGTHIPFQENILKIHKAHVMEGDSRPGERGVMQGCPALGTGAGWLVLDVVQPAGKKPMPGKAFLSGTRGWITAGNK